MRETTIWAVMSVAVLVSLAAMVIELLRLRLELRRLRSMTFGAAHGLATAVGDLHDAVRALTPELAALRAAVAGGSEDAARSSAGITDSGVLPLHLDEPPTGAAPPESERTEVSPRPPAGISQVIPAPDDAEDDDPEETVLYDRTAVSPGANAARGRR